MSGKSEKFFDAITRVREDLIEDAQNYRFHKKSAVWKRFASLAASIVLIVSIGFLAIVPRGCGSSGNSSGSGADSSAPASFDSSMNNAPAPQDPASSELPPTAENSGGSSGAAPGDAPSGESPEEGGDPSDGSSLGRFTAVILEIQDDGLLVEQVDSSQQYLVSTALIDYTDLSEGDQIIVTYHGPVHTTNPPMILAVDSIEKNRS